MIIVWDNGRLVGMARCMTDFVYVTYLADIAVDDCYQRQGTGKQLIREIQKNSDSNAKGILTAVPQAVDYYGHIGFAAHPSVWILNRPL
ncbi:GNAT family N-acetyltransferase [Snodgrassella gandavensis]|uniref:GNAT family N-acetyltransferase n=1 Tax=Snodgrassella gandavensis TaxID=2946698 RepID=UPI0030B81158